MLKRPEATSIIFDGSVNNWGGGAADSSGRDWRRTLAASRPECISCMSNNLGLLQECGRHVFQQKATGKESSETPQGYCLGAGAQEADLLLKGSLSQGERTQKILRSGQLFLALKC